MIAGKWEERYNKQVQANNLLSDKLRATRKLLSDKYAQVQQAYQEKVTEVLTLKLRMQTLEEAMLATIPEQTYEDDDA